MTTARLHHVDLGRRDKPVVVLGSSLGTTHAMWDPQVPALSERFRVVAYDHRGHGGSDVPPGPYEIADLGSDVLALLDGLGIDQFSYAGLSLGGMVGMWVGSEVPERVTRLALICTSAALEATDAWNQRAASVRAGGMAAVVDPVVARWFTPEFAAGEPDLVESYRAMLAATPVEGYAGCCEAIAPMDLRERLPRITASAVAVAGGQDPAIPPPHSAAIVDKVRDARLVVLDHAAHLASVEQADAVTSLLIDHLGGD